VNGIFTILQLVWKQLQFIFQAVKMKTYSSK